MAFSNIQEENNFFNLDFIHDFATGNFTRGIMPLGGTGTQQQDYAVPRAYISPAISPFFPVFPQQAKSWEYTTFSFPNGYSIGGNSVTFTQTNAYNYWGIAITLNGNMLYLPGASSTYSPSNNGGISYWKQGNNQAGYTYHDLTLVNQPSQVSSNNNNFDGNVDVPVVVTTAGTHTLVLWLYHLKITLDTSGGNRPPYWSIIGRSGGPTYAWNTPSDDYNWTKTVTFSVYQKAVAITKVNGNVAIDNTSYSISTAIAVGLDKTDNRGDGVASFWKILKNSGGTFIPATLGADYVFNSGSALTDDAININFTSPGYYQVINYAEGSNSSRTNTASNSAIHTLFFQIASVISEQINLPYLLTVVTPVVSVTNTTISQTGVLTGMEVYNVDVSPSLDLSQAYYRISTDGGAYVDQAFTEADWITFIDQKCIVTMIVKKNGVTINTYTGWGPYTLSLTNGEYEIGYRLQKKGFFRAANLTVTPIQEFSPL